MLSDVQYLPMESIDLERDLEDVDWLQLLHLFSVVEVLHVSGEVVKDIASAQNDIPEEMDAQVLSVLQLLWLDDGQDQKEGKRQAASLYASNLADHRVT